MVSSPMSLPAELVDGLGVTGVTPVHGGDIAKAYRLETPDGPLFAKTHPDPKPGMFEREAAGLRALRAAGAVAVPEVVRESPAGLVLEWIDVGRRTADGATRRSGRNWPLCTGSPDPASAGSTTRRAATSARSRST